MMRTSFTVPMNSNGNETQFSYYSCQSRHEWIEYTTYEAVTCITSVLTTFPTTCDWLALPR